MNPERWRKVRIVGRPIGEAPDWVRDAWIGVELPLAEPDLVTVETVGVLSPPTTRLGLWWARLRGRVATVSGFVVPSARAIDLLAGTRADAADWWRVHAADFCDPEQTFLFDAPACEPSAEPLRGRPWG